jgi:hypothetical protein
MVTNMSEQILPADLVQARQDFLAAMAEEARIARELPSAIDPDGHVREIDPQDAARLDAVRAECQRLALAINDHPYIAGAPNRFAAWKAVNDAAKAGLADTDADRPAG